MPTAAHAPASMNEEIASLERQILELREKLRAARHAAEPEPVKDFTLRTPSGDEIRLSGLFGDRDELIVLHNMGSFCSYCTLWADGLEGLVPHVQTRAAFAMVSGDTPEKLAAFGARRWGFPVFSGAGSGFAEAMCMTTADGGVMPGLSAFRKTPGGIVRTGFAYLGPGDEFCGLWGMFEMLGVEGWKPEVR